MLGSSSKQKNRREQPEEPVALSRLPLGPVKELLRVVEMRHSLFEGNGVQWGQ